MDEIGDEIEDICSEIQILAEEAVRANASEGILLSGGLDTSILAVIASNFTELRAITVAFENAPAPDVEYATLMANELGLEHTVHILTEDELYSTIPEVVSILKSFDPMEIRNSVAIYAGLKAAKEMGMHTIMTGDGCDELFAGYSFLFGMDKEELDMELKKLWDVMFFSSVPLSTALGMKANLPYLEHNFKDFAMKLDSKYKIRIENGNIQGKWILRKAFEKMLPQEITWRVKTPIEYGSGTTTLPDFFNKKISDIEFENKKRKYLAEDKVTIRDKEHLFYYEAYRSLIGVPHPVRGDGKICPQCNSNVPEKATYCRTCGAYPI
ncbi:MAG: asparagine synthase-related protein [Methermicoccaceae archaeon]